MIYEAKEFTVKDNLKVVLRTPDVKQAPEVLDFIKNAADQTDFLLSSSEDFNFTVEKEENFIESCREGNDYFIVVEVDEKIVGDCSLNFNTHLKDRHRGKIGIAIDEAYWNRGIGSLLFDEMIRLAEEKDGIEQLELGVLDNNERAKHLYESKGFEYIGRIPRAIKQKDGTYHDEEMMVKFIK